MDRANADYAGVNHLPLGAMPPNAVSPTPDGDAGDRGIARNARSYEGVRRISAPS